MKLLFDQNLSHKLCQQLSDLFPGSSQVRLIGLDKADDRTLWEFARTNGYTLVSLDADLADMARCGEPAVNRNPSRSVARTSPVTSTSSAYDELAGLRCTMAAILPLNSLPQCSAVSLNTIT